MKRLIYVIMALAMVMVVLGDIDCYTNQVCRLGDFVYTDAFVEITSRICKISIWYPNETIVVNNADMTNLSTGFHYYEYTPTLTGDYAAEMTCNNSGDVGKLDRSFTVSVDSTNNNLSFVSISLILIAVIGFLFFIGNTWKYELFVRDQNLQKQNLIKVVLVVIGLWLLLPMVRFAESIASDMSLSTNVQTLISSFYTPVTVINIVITTYLVIFATYNMFLYFGVDVLKSFKRK